MSLSRKQVEAVAELARLKFSEAELATLTVQLNQIVEYVNRLQQVDTTGVEPLAHALDLANVFREDEPTPSLSVEAALANAPARRGNFYSVPAVLDSQ